MLLRPGARVSQFYADGVDCTPADGTAGSPRGYDSIVPAMGSRPSSELKEAAAALSRNFPGNSRLNLPKRRICCILSTIWTMTLEIEEKF